jgi:hypothetical protein
MAPDFVNRALLSGSHPVLDLGEGLLDRVEVGRVWRQVPEPCASGLDHLPDGGRLVGAEIVHDDDVAGLERADELLFDIGAEALAVARPVEDARGGKPVAARRAQKGQRAPVAVRGKGAQPLAFRPPALKEIQHNVLSPSKAPSYRESRRVVPGPCYCDVKSATLMICSPSMTLGLAIPRWRISNYYR